MFVLCQAFVQAHITKGGLIKITTHHGMISLIMPHTAVGQRGTLVGPDWVNKSGNLMVTLSFSDSSIEAFLSIRKVQLQPFQRLPKRGRKGAMVSGICQSAPATYHMTFAMF